MIHKIHPLTPAFGTVLAALPFAFDIPPLAVALAVCFTCACA